MERKKEETKKRIIAAALRLFKERGIEAASMEMIAEEADIARGTLYNYFPVKEAIIDEHIKRSFREKNPARSRELQSLPDTRARLICFFSMLIDGVQAHKDIFERYIVYRMQQMVSFQQTDTDKSGFNLAADEIIALGQKNGEIRKDLPDSVLVELFEFAFIEAVKQIFREPDEVPEQRIIERYVDLCINGIREGGQ